MSGDSIQEATRLLHKRSDGDQAAFDELTPIIYDERHRIARLFMNRRRENLALQTSALVNEAYVRLIDWKSAKCEKRAPFFGISANLMRLILVDFARKRPRVIDEAIRRLVGQRNGGSFKDFGDCRDARME